MSREDLNESYSMITSEAKMHTQGVVFLFNNPTAEKLRDLKLNVMAQMMSEPDQALLELTFEERLGIMVEKEWIAKRNSRIKRLLKDATLGLSAFIEDIDYSADRSIDKKAVQNSATCSFVEQEVKHRDFGEDRQR